MLKNLRLGMNLKNLMSGIGYHIPAVFAMDTRLDGKDLVLIGIMLSHISNNGECMPTDQQLADGIRYTTESIHRIREKLWELEYLSWEPSPSDNRKNLYEFNIPYWSPAWQQALNWRDPLFNFTEEGLEVYFTKILDGIVEPEEITQKILVKVLLNTNTKLINNSSNISRSKSPKKFGSFRNTQPKPDKRKSKRGRREEKCLSDPSNKEFYEDDPKATLLLINTYSTWLLRRSGGKGHGPAFIRSNSTYYKYFVKLRKKLLSFRGDRSYPGVQSLFWDYFTFLGREFDKRGFAELHITQMPSDGIWEIYTNYITQNFPDGSYWFGETFRVDEVSGGVELIMEEG